MAYMVMAYMVMAYTVMAYMIMAYKVLAYTVMAYKSSLHSYGTRVRPALAHIQTSAPGFKVSGRLGPPTVEAITI